LARRQGGQESPVLGTQADDFISAGIIAVVELLDPKLQAANLPDQGPVGLIEIIPKLRRVCPD
jgi:hypothetical protein